MMTRQPAPRNVYPTIAPVDGPESRYQNNNHILDFYMTCSASLYHNVIPL